MTIRRFNLLFLLLLAFSTRAIAQEVRYTTSSVRMRAEATTDAAVLATVPSGARVGVRACVVDWCWVEYRNRTGYIAERFLTLKAPRVENGEGDGYTNSAGEWVPSPRFSPSGPAGASARCRDGTYSFSRSRRGTCSHHGGVASWL